MALSVQDLPEYKQFVNYSTLTGLRQGMCFN